VTCLVLILVLLKFSWKVIVTDAPNVRLFRDLAGDSSPLASVIPGATSSGVVQLADLQRILTGLGQPSGADLLLFNSCLDSF